MTTMKALQVSKPGGKFELVDRPIPQPGPNQIRIRVEACGMCHSDVFVRSGQFPKLVLPRVPGHEVAGRVDAVGPGVTAWTQGQRVGVGWHGGHCWQCTACRKGDFLNCTDGKITGISFHGKFFSRNGDDCKNGRLRSASKLPEGGSVSTSRRILTIEAS